MVIHTPGSAARWHPVPAYGDTSHLLRSLAAMSAPSDMSFTRLLAWAYRGEIRGEVLFTELAERFQSDLHTSKLLVLAELERNNGSHPSSGP